MHKYTVHQGNNAKLFIPPALEKRGNWREDDQRSNFIWKPTGFPSNTYAKLDGLQGLVHNHLDNNRVITTKPGLVRVLRKYYSAIDSYSVYDTIPTSFTITAHVQDMEYRHFVYRFKEIRKGFSNTERLPLKHCAENMWLVKPAALNQGRGIEVMRSLAQIKQFLKSKKQHSLWLIQKYIERPLLIHGRKFDIRIWALLTAKKEIFYYRKGYLRTSSSEYDTSAKDNYIHLTNNCLQKHGDNYGVHEEGNTLSFEEFQTYLEANHEGVNFWEHILPRMKDLMIDVFCASKHILHKGKRNLVFELVGFDFLIDEDFRVWLIEANTNPYLGVPNDYIGNLIPMMIDDLLEVTVDPYFPPLNPRERSTNDFELLYCESGSIHSEVPVNQRRSFDMIYPFEELAQVPMSQSNPQDSELAELKSAEKPTANTPLQSALNMIDTEFEAIYRRIMDHLGNWELIPESEVHDCIQGLQVIANEHKHCVNQEFCDKLVTLLTHENTPAQIQESLIETVSILADEFKLVPMLLQSVQWLITQVTDSINIKVHKLSIEILVKFIRAGIPKEVFINGGVLGCLLMACNIDDNLRAIWHYICTPNDLENLMKLLDSGSNLNFPPSMKTPEFIKAIRNEIKRKKQGKKKGILTEISMRKNTENFKWYENKLKQRQMRKEKALNEWMKTKKAMDKEKKLLETHLEKQKRRVIELSQEEERKSLSSLSSRLNKHKNFKVNSFKKLFNKKAMSANDKLLFGVYAHVSYPKKPIRRKKIYINRFNQP